MPILTGFQNLANAGVFGAPKNAITSSEAAFNNAGSSNILSDLLDIGQFGLSVFQTVRGNTGSSNPSSSITAVSTVPTPGSSVGRFAGNFAPGSGVVQAGMRLPPGLAGSVIVKVGGGVANILRKIKVNTNMRMTTKKIVSAIRQFGADVVADWAGISMEELMVIWDRGSRRVKRRFTKRDRSRGRSYIRFLKRNADELKDMGCGPKTRTRKRSC